jgi:hypothetical protein
MLYLVIVIVIVHRDERWAAPAHRHRPIAHRARIYNTGHGTGPTRARAPHTHTAAKAARGQRRQEARRPLRCLLLLLLQAARLLLGCSARSRLSSCSLPLVG